MGPNRLGLFDTVAAELNPKPTRAEQLRMRFGRPRIPDRPDDGAGQDVWVAYVVALGAEREPAEALTVAQLAEFAGRLGG